jgi:hypothetical protein
MNPEHSLKAGGSQSHHHAFLGAEVPVNGIQLFTTVCVDGHGHRLVATLSAGLNAHLACIQVRRVTAYYVGHQAGEIRVTETHGLDGKSARELQKGFAVHNFAVIIASAAQPRGSAADGAAVREDNGDLPYQPNSA